MKQFKSYIIIILGCLLAVLNAHSQNDSIANKQDSTAPLWPQMVFGNFPKKANATLQQLSINGYYRFITNYRHLYESYTHLRNNRNNIFVGDDSQIPQLMLNISGSVDGATSFGTDLFMWSPMTGAGQAQNVKGLNLGISLYGTHNTKHGEFNIRTGGINWYALSPFTFQANKGYDRYSIFERNPWDPNTSKVISRYETFYNVGAINQDTRWGNQAFQGVIAEGNKLPHGLSTSIMYGKTQLDGGLSPIPNASYGGKIKKEYGNNFISINTFNNRSFTDSLQKKQIGFNIVTTEFAQHTKYLNINGEIGLGQTYVQNQNNKWGILLSIKASKVLAKNHSIELHAYRISPRVFNNSAIFINSSIQQNFTASQSNQLVLPAVASALTQIGQLVNNRQGIEVNTQINFGKFKNNIGYATSMELQNLSNKITYGHPINSLVMSRFWRWNFPSDVGPYNNISRIYRGVYETVLLTDIDNTTLLPKYKKYFNAFEINSKYSFKLARKPMYIFYLGQFSSAQNKFSLFTQLTPSALLRTYYHQLEFYYSLSNAIVWTNYLGAERIIANYQTEVNATTQRPKNQSGYSWATGFDVRLSKGAGLYVKQRWFQHQDANYNLDKFRGWESTVELKVFF
jgi:hypothetical protein